MKELLSYWQYNYLICFGADWNNNIHIVGSSNRAIKTDVLLRVEDDTTEAKDLPLLNYSVFSRYFKLLSKGKDQLSKNENATLASIRDLFTRIKARFLKEKGISLETAQILFIMPLGWTEKERYNDRMREFFLNINWIKPKDSESKLIMIPTIQVLADYFQESAKQKKQEPLDRERTSVLFSMQPASDEDKEDGRVKFSYTFFKMQSAKALITVSKTLASSDFLLVPSITSSKSLHLANLDSVMYNAVKKILARVKGEEQKRVSMKKEDDPAWTIVFHLLPIHESKFGLMSNWNKEILLEDVILEKQHHLQDLTHWTCNQLLAAIFEDVHVRDYFKQVSDFFKGALDEYGAIKNSPDGIQHTLFYSDWKSSHDNTSSTAGQDYTDYIVQALMEENLIQSGNDFSGINLISNAQFAMQHSYKMIQIANAILPPVIVGDEEAQNSSSFPAHKYTDSLITPNSFYVQANVTDMQISFILNKVIQVPSSSRTGVELFTVQERSVNVGHVTDTALDVLWNHYEFAVNLEEQQHTLFKRCQHHDTIMVLSSSHYNEFKKNGKKLIDSWFAAENTLSGEGSLDAYHLVSVDQQCTCALKLSQRLLLEVGFKPVIANIATTVASALFSNDFFGLYQISALILENSLKSIKNLYFSYSIDRMLRQALVGLLQVQHSRLLLLFHDEERVIKDASHLLGRGVYSQASNMTFTFKIELWPAKDKDEVVVGLLESGVCKKIPLVPVQRKRNSNNSFMFTYSGLTKEEDLPLEGVHSTFFIKDCNFLSIEVHVSDHPEKSTNQHIVGSAPFDFTGRKLCSPITLKLLPENYSSNIKFVASLSLVSSGRNIFNRVGMSTRQSDDRGEPYVFGVKKSVDIVERISLKK